MVDNSLEHVGLDPKITELNELVRQRDELNRLIGEQSVKLDVEQYKQKYDYLGTRYDETTHADTHTYAPLTTGIAEAYNPAIGRGMIDTTIAEMNSWPVFEKVKDTHTMFTTKKTT